MRGIFIALLNVVGVAITLGYAPAAFSGGSDFASRSPALPSVDANVVSVSVGPRMPGGRYRIVVTVDDIYHHVFVDWLSFAGEGEGPAKVASRYAVTDLDLGGGRFSIKSLDELTWSGPSSVQLRVNERKRCRLLLFESRYDADCDALE